MYLVRFRMFFSGSTFACGLTSPSSGWEEEFAVTVESAGFEVSAVSVSLALAIWLCCASLTASRVKRRCSASESFDKFLWCRRQFSGVMWL
jgi:hypothetical protein